MNRGVKVDDPHFSLMGLVGGVSMNRGVKASQLRDDIWRVFAESYISMNRGERSLSETLILQLNSSHFFNHETRRIALQETTLENS